VQITREIIEALQAERSLGITILANRLGYSKSTIHSHLATLRETRLVVKEEELLPCLSLIEGSLRGSYGKIPSR